MKLLLAFPCGAELLHLCPEHRATSTKTATASGPDLDALGIGGPWILKGSSRKICGEACACLHTFRELIALVGLHAGNDELPVSRKFEADLIQGHRQVAEVDHRHTPAIATGLPPCEIAAWCYAQVYPVPVERTPGVENAEGGAQQSQAEGDLGIHGCHSASGPVAVNQKEVA